MLTFLSGAPAFEYLVCLLSFSDSFSFSRQVYIAVRLFRLSDLLWVFSHAPVEFKMCENAIIELCFDTF
jgi:hypothetical protein